MTSYNYDRFGVKLYDLDSFPGPLPGEPAPDFQAQTLAGRPVRLSDYTGSIVVLETGSVSCPMYVGHIGSMNELTGQWPEVTFLVLYVREAHPGRRIGPHTNGAAKRLQAARLAPEEAESRTILVDDVAGTVHRAFGSLPNFVYVIGEDGRVRWRSDWNDPGAVSRVLERLAAGEDQPDETGQFQPVGLATVLRVLRRAGWDAVSDFVLSLPRLMQAHRRAHHS